MTQDLYWFRQSALRPVEGRSVVLLEPRCSREFGELQAFEWEIALVGSDQISPFRPMGTLPFIVQGGSPLQSI
jgi:hypothetical protein